MDALLQADREAKDPHEREHVTPYFYRHPERFRLWSITDSVDRSHLNWSVDTAEDLGRVTMILEALKDAPPLGFWPDIYQDGDYRPLAAAIPDYKQILTVTASV
jgi:spore coat polysaccharide biosynthesis protein SpsF